MVHGSRTQNFQNDTPALSIAGPQGIDLQCVTFIKVDVEGFERRLFAGSGHGLVAASHRVADGDQARQPAS